MKIAGYLAIAVAAVLFLMGGVDTFQNYFELKDARRAIADMQPCVDGKLPMSACGGNENQLSWPEKDGIFALAGFVFLIPGIAMAAHNSRQNLPGSEVQKC